LNLSLDLNYFSFSNSNPNPNPTHLPKHQTLIISFLSVFDMYNITLCMRTWREVRKLISDIRSYLTLVMETARDVDETVTFEIRVARSLDIFQGHFVFQEIRWTTFMGVRRGGNVFLPTSLEIGTKGQSTPRTSQKLPGVILCFIALGNSASCTAQHGTSWPQKWNKDLRLATPCSSSV